MRRLAIPALFAFLPLSLLSCSDSTGPGPVSLSLVAGPGLGHHEVDGEIFVRCAVDFEISVAPGVEGGARMTGGTLRFRSEHTGEDLGTFDVAPVDQVIPAGETRRQGWTFWAEHVYHLRGTFDYDVGDGRESVEFDFTCAPDGPVPGGTWELESINGQPLPARGHSSRMVHEAWIMVFPTNLTAILRADVDWNEHREGTVLLTQDEDGVFWFPELVPGFGRAGAVSLLEDRYMEVDEYQNSFSSLFTWEFRKH